jgi:hypothetical protein
MRENEAKMNQFKVERLCTWSGMVGVTLFFLGFIFSHFIPPPSPSLSQEQVVAQYQQNANGIRTGMVVMMISGMFIMPMVGVISAQLKRIKGISPALTYAQISAGTAGSVFFIVAAVLFLVTAYRPDRPPELTFMMNDLCWIMVVIPWPPAFIQNIVIATAIIHDESPQPIFPRWLAFFNIWVAIGFLPGSLLPFFKKGPLAWNGIFAFWLAGTVFVIWFIVVTVMLLKAINRQEQEAALQ